MVYRVKCPDYKRAASTAIAFGKLYGASSLSSREPKVTAGEHTFIFVYGQKKYKDEIKLEDFLKKYFNPAREKS